MVELKSSFIRHSDWNGVEGRIFDGGYENRVKEILQSGYYPPSG